MLPDNGSPAYLSLGEAASYLGLTERTLRTYIATGKLPAYRLGPKQIRLRRSDVEGLLTRIPAAS